MTKYVRFTLGVLVAIWLLLVVLAPIAGWIVATNCCVCCMQVGLTPKELRQKLIGFTICWTAITVTYTVLTINDMGDIPFNCPTDHLYQMQQLRSACIIRTINFIIIWIYACLVIIFLIAAFSGILPSDDEIKKKGKDFNIRTIIEGV